MAAIRMPVRKLFIIVKSADSQEVAVFCPPQVGATGRRFKTWPKRSRGLGSAAWRCHIFSMFEKFTARRPKPRRAPVAPLQEAARPPAKAADTKADEAAKGRPKELGGPSGPEPTRYGDWERKGICVDF